MTIETVAVTGGSGFIGGEIVEVLNDRGYETVNIDRESGDGSPDQFVCADVTDAGEAYGAIARVDADAVIHMATITNPRHDPGHVTFESNAMSGYTVLEVAEELGLEAATLASSVHAYGWAYQDDPIEIDYLPLDEEHRVSPRDPYALGKHVTEELCDGFARKGGPPHTLATLRFPWVASDEQLRDRFADADRSLPALRERYDPDENPLFAYVHVRDAAELAVLTIEADYEGHERFCAVAPDSTADAPTEEVLETFYPDTEVRQPLTGTDGLFDVSKARDLVGWDPGRSWRDL